MFHDFATNYVEEPDVLAALSGTEEYAYSTKLAPLLLKEEIDSHSEVSCKFSRCDGGTHRIFFMFVIDSCHRNSIYTNI